MPSSQDPPRHPDPDRPDAKPGAAPGGQLSSDLRAASGLVIHAVTGVVDVVEGMHRNIARLSPPVGSAPDGRMGGLTGLVYRGVRGVTRGVGQALDRSLAAVSPWLRGAPSLPQREAVLAALNGAFGDHMATVGNNLAITMQLRQDGEALTLTRDSLAQRFAGQPGRVLVAVHGLCMNDVQWHRKGHDHAAALARDEGLVPLYLHYNTGLHIGDNGQSLHRLLSQLMQVWPVPITELIIVGHSMGGLVALSACHQAGQTTPSAADWLSKVSTLVTLGSPHQGASLEKAGAWASYLLAISPYSAPLAGLARARSAGIQDLRHGDLFKRAQDEAAQREGGEGKEADVLSPRQAVQSLPRPLPASLKVFALAGSRKPEPHRLGRIAGDGLVSVASALAVTSSDQHIAFGVDHFDLLSDAQVYAQLRQWLTPPVR